MEHHRFLSPMATPHDPRKQILSRSFRVHFGTGGIVHHTILAKGGNTKEVVNGLPIQCGESCLLI
jgi:hypothetical protein